MSILSGSRNTLFSLPVSLNANELLLPAPFFSIELGHYSWYLLKNTVAPHCRTEDPGGVVGST